MLRSSALLALVVPVLAVASAPAATHPALTVCGLTPSKAYLVSVDAGSTCAFGMATYRAAVAIDRNFVAAVSVRYTLKVQSARDRVTLDCRNDARAHGQFDISCNNLDRGGTRVVRIDNQTLP